MCEVALVSTASVTCCYPAAWSAHKNHFSSVAVQTSCLPGGFFCWDLLLDPGCFSPSVYYILQLPLSNRNSIRILCINTLARESV